MNSRQIHQNGDEKSEKPFKVKDVRSCDRYDSGKKKETQNINITPSVLEFIDFWKLFHETAAIFTLSKI